ncbi:hypothetical protein BD289DRAFT_457296 [Coniella lustricola]|uniref:Apple domain-containing protein n=1 Tax=Coniella lustricola TaxID=2025994 RepID=A0A2T2ZSF1_9PEZI|nr:hypothetical protein BD289DRAFT_457296 [Coniella lustricola]
MKLGAITLAVLGLAAPAAAVSCGLSNGYDKGTPAYYYNNNGSLANFAACSTKCLADTKCESFAIGDSQCLLYAEPLDTNFRYQANSPFLFYDRDCSSVQSTSSFMTTMPATTALVAATGTAASGNVLAQTTSAAAATATSSSTSAATGRASAAGLAGSPLPAAALLLVSCYFLA